MSFQKIVSIICLITMFGCIIIAFADDGVYVRNWSSLKSDYAVAANDVRLNVRTPPGTYTGLGYCKARVGSESLTDGGILWVRVQGSGEDRTYDVREYKVKVYGTSRSKSASAWGWL